METKNKLKLKDILTYEPWIQSELGGRTSHFLAYARKRNWRGQFSTQELKEINGILAEQLNKDEIGEMVMSLQAAAQSYLVKRF